VTHGGRCPAGRSSWRRRAAGTLRRARVGQVASGQLRQQLAALGHQQPSGRSRAQGAVGRPAQE